MENVSTGFSMLNTSVPTNENIVIKYKPNQGIIRYKYSIYKNNELFKELQINNNEVSTIILDATGKYNIVIEEYNYYNVSNTIESGIYEIDKEKPILTVEKDTVTMHLGDKLDIMNGVTALDEYDGNLTSKVSTNLNQININEKGMKKLIYSVSDSAGNVTEKNVYITVKSNPAFTFFIQGLFLVLILIISFLIIKYRKSIMKERRISSFTIDCINDNSPTFIDKFTGAIINIISKTSVVLTKSVFLTKYSKKYDKYVDVINKEFKTGIDYISFKFFIGFLFIVIAFVTKTFQYKAFSIYEIWFPLLIGFFLPDILFIFLYRFHRKKIENDLLQAIIIMNNAFKSGRTISQSIYLVTTELDGPIQVEFKKMYMELNLGLDLETAFSRFAERINLEEVNYLTASLSIINRTGGNIIKVFSSIEKTLFNKKRLKLELNSLTGGSKIIIYALSIVPILFVVFVSIVDPGYFLPLITTTFGLIILAIILIYYIIYIIFVVKIMKVRM